MSALLKQNFYITKCDDRIQLSSVTSAIEINIYYVLLTVSFMKIDAH